LLAHRSAAASTLGLVASVALLLSLVPGSALAAAGTIKGQVNGGNPFPGAFRVTLFQARPGASGPRTLGSTLTRRGGNFTLRYRGATTSGVRYLIAGRRGGGAEAGFPVPVSSLRLAAALGDRHVPRRATINERTTVATGFAMAQFFSGGGFAGKKPGLRNAAAMTRDLAGRRRGALSPVLQHFPNGGSTSTLQTFDSLANLVASCRRPGARCAQLLRLAGRPGAAPSANTLGAMVAIARYPWHNVRGLFKLARLARPVYGPYLGRGERPDAWTLALRFEGVRRTMNGPGNIAIDAGGSPWVINNYEYTRNIKGGPCAGKQLLRFTPTGRGYPGSPYEGGGISGAGYGVTFDPKGRIWVGNFGFAARGCAETPPKNSVSLFKPNGEAISPDFHTVIENGKEVTKGGYEQGNIDAPQGVVSDGEGNIWIANCGNSSVTRYAGGYPASATNIGQSQTGLLAPFDIAVNRAGYAFVTGNGSDSVAILRPDGTPAANSPIVGHGLHRPMGIATDSRGYMWVANSEKVVIIFCPEAVRFLGGPSRGSVVLLKPNGEPARRRPFKGGGNTDPLGDRGRRQRHRMGRQLRRQAPLPGLRYAAEALPARETTHRRLDLSPQVRLRLRRPGPRHWRTGRPLRQRLARQQLEAETRPDQSGGLPAGRLPRGGGADQDAADRTA
jgi:hypothetical protein